MKGWIKLNIKIELIGPIKEIIRESTIELETSDENLTLNDLLNILYTKYSKLKDKLLMSNGDLQYNIHIYLRDERVENLQYKLSDYKNNLKNEVVVTIFLLQAFTGG